MKLRKWKVLCLCLLFTILALALINVKSEDFSIMNNCTNFTDIDLDSAYIDIHGDDDFQNYSFPGSGTSNDPYVIENIDFTTDDAIGISIQFTSSYFIIRNCYFRTNQYAIKIHYIQEESGIIEENIFEGRGSSTKLSYANKINIINNKFRNGTYGLFIKDTKSAIITNNNFDELKDSGISLYDSYSIEITNNTLRNCRAGVFVSGSSSIIMINNIFEGTGFHTNSVDPSFFDMSIIVNNTINKKKFGYFKSLNDTVFTSNDYGQYFFYNCRKITIKDVTVRDTSSGIMLYNCRDFRIENSINLFNTYCGIYIISSNDFEITNNSCYHNTRSGVRISGTTNALIRDNYFFDNYRSGIDIGDASDINVTDNICFMNGNGIACYWNTYNIKITKNLFEQNKGVGVGFDEWTGDCYVFQNSFFYNSISNPYSKKQASDSSRNYWYNPDMEIGNYWSDLGDENKYEISNDKYDLFPLEQPPIEPLSSYPDPITITVETYFIPLSIVIVSLFLISFLFRAKSKKSLIS